MRVHISINLVHFFSKNKKRDDVFLFVMRVEFLTHVFHTGSITNVGVLYNLDACRFWRLGFNKQNRVCSSTLMDINVNRILVIRNKT